MSAGADRGSLGADARERLDATRALVGAFATVYLLVRLRYFADLSAHDASQLAPVGVARILSAPLPLGVTWALAVATLGLGAAFTAGVRLRLVAPAFFVALLWVTTYRSSFGKILHSENLVVLHVGVLAIGGAAAAWTLRTMSLVTVLTYFVAGVAKLRAGGAAWMSGEALGDWLAFDTLRKIELGSLHSPLAVVVASHGALLQALAVFTLAVELGAPLALLTPRAGKAWSVLAWLFHVGIVTTMAIGFFYPLSFVAFASFFDATLVVGRVRRLRCVRRLRRALPLLQRRSQR